MDGTAVLKLGPVLLVALQGDLDDSAAERLQEAVLERLYATGALGILIDVSALEMVDSFVARLLRDLAAMVSLLGARLVLVGMQPMVTVTLIEMGLVLPELETDLDLEAGLQRLGYELSQVKRLRPAGDAP